MPEDVRPRRGRRRDHRDRHVDGRPAAVHRRLPPRRARATLVETGPARRSIRSPTPSIAPGRRARRARARGRDAHPPRPRGRRRRPSERFPSATIWVHERGAPHLADPTRLVASATRAWGEREMARSSSSPWSRSTRPGSGRSPTATRSRWATGRSRSWTRRATRRTTSRSSTSRTGAVFTGDALGIHVPDLPVLRPATPPPDFDLERYVASIERIREASSSVLLFAHFGPADRGGRHVRPGDPPRPGLGPGRRGRDGETDDPDELASRLEAAALDDIETGAEATLDLEMLEDRLRLLSSIRMNAQGLARYWRKRRERAEERSSAV